MAQTTAISVQNNFSKGLITEASGLNFPENACTETFDCVFNRNGSVRRRLGLDNESNSSSSTINRNGTAVSSYIWKNATGDGTVDLWVNQIGNLLYFWRISDATTSSGASQKLQADTVTLTGVVGFNSFKTAQFADGNGYLFVTHPDCEPRYVTYTDTNTINDTSITLQIRDTTGIAETGVADNDRARTLSDTHRYNLNNQGWNKYWSTTSTSTETIASSGNKNFTVASSTLPIIAGDRVLLNGGASAVSEDQTATNSMTAIVTLYSGTTLNTVATGSTGAGTFSNWRIQPKPRFIADWFIAIGNYPSNSDQWWYFRNPDPANNSFDPAATIDEVSVNAGPAPKGHFILSAFDQQRDTISGISGLADVTSGGIRPAHCAWFAGRVWYAGVKARGFSENIYFSQIIENTDQFGRCYQVNDPTSEERFDLLPSDGGVIRIQGVGNIHKLFPIQNGVLVFSDKGIWFITGSQGIGFTANDYTVTKISDIKAISEWSFTNVRGYPMFWAEEGIYYLVPAQGGFEVKSLTDETIGSFFQTIPFAAKIFARGAYDPLNNLVRWVYRSTAPSSTTTSEDRFQYDRVLNYDVGLNAFYPWTISAQSDVKVADVMYFPFGGQANSPPAIFKFYMTNLTGASQTHTFAEEKDTTYKDWETPGVGVDFTSYFITGYNIRGQGIKKFQQKYLMMHCVDDVENAFKIQSRWNYSIASGSGKWSTEQTFTNSSESNFDHKQRRIHLRGRGYVAQIKVTSVTAKAFELAGWSIFETGNRWI